MKFQDVKSQAVQFRTVRFQVWDVPTLRTRLDEVVAVYRAAFLDVYERDPERATAERRAHARTHLDRPGIRAVAALVPALCIRPGRFPETRFRQAPTGPPTTHPTCRPGGQAGRLRVRSPRPGRPVVARRRHPIGATLGRRDLVRRLLRDRRAPRPARLAGTWNRSQTAAHAAVRGREETAALSALASPDTRARRLYDSERFHPLHDRFRFPGSPTEYAILVKRLRQPNGRDALGSAPAVTRP